MLQSYEPIYLESALSCEQEAKNLVQIGPGQLGPRQLGLGPDPKNFFKKNIHNRIALFLDTWKVNSYQFLKCVYNSTFLILSWFLCEKPNCLPWNTDSWALTSVQGPTVRGPAVWGPSVRGPADWGPIVRGPICQKPLEFVCICVQIQKYSCCLCALLAGFKNELGLERNLFHSIRVFVPNNWDSKYRITEIQQLSLRPSGAV